METIVTASGIALAVEKQLKDDGSVEIAISMEPHQPCLLHWGIRLSNRAEWQLPPRSAWPEGTRTYDHLAVQTPFQGVNGPSRIVVALDRTLDLVSLEFVLFFPKDNRWDNNKGRNYHILVPRPPRPVEEPTPPPRAKTATQRVCYEKAFDVEPSGRLEVNINEDEDRFHITLTADLPGPLLLHWGVTPGSRREWQPPPPGLLPPGSVLFQEKAAQTPFVDNGRSRRLELEIMRVDAPAGIVFVLKQGDTGRWLKDRGGNFFVPLPGVRESAAFPGNAEVARLAEVIIEREMSGNSWTLMHRFNLCHDLLDQVGGSTEDFALLYVWLRYSAIRQLDWQRNYNTKPRELSHALDRLTLKLADRYLNRPGEREWLRLMMSTLGRGSNGQEVRDEILRIMHRHHIKEVSGHFLEEWHQKLHNNTTPDDVVICEAYLGFLKSNGGLDEFYRILERGGVTRARLQSYERPINSHPDFVFHLKEALIPDFEHFLGILKAVHSGTDLGTAIHAARYLFDGDLHGLADFVWHHRDDSGLPPSRLLEKITAIRSRLGRLLETSRNGARDLLFLDLALENYSRVLVERNLHLLSNGNELADLLSGVLENQCLSRPDEELTRCLCTWRRLQAIPRFDRDWSLRAKAVLDRLARAVSSFIDRYTALLQPLAVFLGSAFQAARWSVDLFTEEVIRGQLEFALSAMLRRLDPILRERADLGSWQVISPASAAGYVETVSHLLQVQGRSLARPTVVVAQKVGGDEEIPEGVTAIITPDAVDIVSHVAVRARNARLLFASCFDPATITRLHSLVGQPISLKTTLAGDVAFEEGLSPAARREVRLPATRPRFHRPVFKNYAIAAQDFNDREVGGKSNNIRRLLGKLPKWVGLPRSAALPFGVFEQVLADDLNRVVRDRCRELAARLEGVAENALEVELAELRTTILDLKAPPQLQSSLQSVMTQAGLPWPEQWGDMWTCIKQVWASKYNERACLSRKAGGISDQDLFMAVLVQEVIQADYSFVIHTVNPVTGNRDEIYAEVVLGLGEALVANYPGRALSFSSRKGLHDPLLLAFPSKSQGLYGGGLIFRSDSNGEDLAEFAGAGLYDSFMLPPPKKALLDYTDEALCWNEHFRKNLLINIALIGTMLERILGSPQDIEGAYSKGQYFVVQARPQVGLAGD